MVTDTTSAPNSVPFRFHDNFIKVIFVLIWKQFFSSLIPAKRLPLIIGGKFSLHMSLVEYTFIYIDFNRQFLYKNSQIYKLRGFFIFKVHGLVLITFNHKYYKQLIGIIFSKQHIVIYILFWLVYCLKIQRLIYLFYMEKM